MITIVCDECQEQINEPDFIGVENNDADDIWAVDFIPIKFSKEYDLVFCNKECIISYIDTKISNDGVLKVSFTKDIKIQES